jgi:glucan phosphoethanolaminetransferase (alkaline phosphatase superfamily)
VLLIISVVVFIKRYRVSHATNKVIWVANSLLFVTSTAHFALMFNHFYTALVRNYKLVMIEDSMIFPTGKCSVQRLRKRDSCTDGSKFDDLCG